MLALIRASLIKITSWDVQVNYYRRQIIVIIKMNLMSNMKQSALDLQSIVDALSKVERANKVDLCPLKQSITSTPVDTLETFSRVGLTDSIDSRYKILSEGFPGLTHQVNYLLEASVLL